MFTGESDRALPSLRARIFGICVGSTLLLAAAAGLVSAKTLSFMFVIVLVSFLAAAALRGQIADAVRPPEQVDWYLGGFIAYAALSSAWSIEPLAAFVTTSYALFVGAGAIFMLQLIDVERRPDLLHLGEGVWIGFSVGLLYLVIELFSGQSIKIVLYNLAELQPGDLAPPEYFTWANGKIVGILREDLTRNMAPVTIFLWPAVAAIMGAVKRRYAGVLSSLLVLIAGVAIMTAWHETSKGAFLVGLAVFASARRAPIVVGRLASVCWVTACLGVLPAVLLAHRFELHKAPWIQYSAQQRIIIWNHTAEQVLKSPLFGVGARTTYFLGPSMEKDLAQSMGNEQLRTLSTHAHSVFLQTWFELGLVGSTLLALVGLALVQSIMGLGAVARPYALATFASAAVMAAASYGMWQYWYMAMFALCAVFFGIAARLLTGRKVDSSENLPRDLSFARG